jgi:hypothetical protein
VWSTFDTLLQPHARLLFAAGVPDTFHSHYSLVAVRLLNQVTDLAPTGTAVLFSLIMMMMLIRMLWRTI